MSESNAEQKRLEVSSDERTWKKWGPYLAERQWGTVREDYSLHGESWDYITHDKARSNAFRWGEEGIGGFCDARQILCMAPAFWNENDPILKERLFGLTNSQGNHGEDVKEVYFHLDASPSHAYCKYLYKYPHAAYPYQELVEKNRRSRHEREYEITDTGVFANGAYFDCYIEYAKAGIDEILMRVTVINRGKNKAKIHVLPHLWFRNFWKHNPRHERPEIIQKEEGHLITSSKRNGTYHYYHDGGEALFCENETNNRRIYNFEDGEYYPKDGINDYIIEGRGSVNPEKKGSKIGIWFKDEIEAGGKREYRVVLSKDEKEDVWASFDDIFEKRISETDEFYSDLLPESLTDHQRHVARSAFGGLMWTKQFYYFDVHKWLNGGPGEKAPDRVFRRNEAWDHMTHRNVITMPDKWEYPWYAAWDLAFHATSFAKVDVDFAKWQLHLMLTEYYMHPNGQIPAYEWNFSDVNPPVHSWAVWDVYEYEKEKKGKADYDFLEKCFQKLLINYTWWVNQKDADGTSLFDGGFLGLDNIGVFDRNHMPPGIKKMEQADATSWMGMFTLNMLRMSIELAEKNPAYEESASKFFRHFLNFGWAMHNIGGGAISLWDDQDAFYYDAVHMHDGNSQLLKVRSLVGLIPLFAVDVVSKHITDNLHEFRHRANKVIRTRPDLAQLISRIGTSNDEDQFLISIMRAYRLEQVLKRMLDEDEFLSDYGIRSLSKYHEKNPFVFEHYGQHSIAYTPGESDTAMFGGNSNWRGPIWFPINYMIIRSLKKFYQYYGDEYVYEFPTGSGNKLNLKQIAKELTLRLMKLFESNTEGRYNYHNDDKDQLYTSDPNFSEHHLFYEFFHGETGRGMGASHQTGWTALIANLMMELED